MTRTKKHELLHTRARIVEAACASFRDDGFDGASIAEIMVSIGMTHGAFYRYFSSKEDLVIATIEEEFKRYPAALDVEKTIHYCLGDTWDDVRSSGCSAVVLTPEVGRCSLQTQQVFQGRVERLFSSLAKVLDGVVEEPRSTALAIFSTIVGSLHLARAVGNGDASAEILGAGAAAARALARRSTWPGPKPE